MIEERLRELAPLAALGVLDGEEAAAFAEAAARSPECRQDLAAFERVVGLIALGEEAVPPHAGLRRRVVSVAAPPRPAATAPAAAPVPRRTPYTGLLAAAAAVLLACLAGYLGLGRSTALRETAEAQKRLESSESRLRALQKDLTEEQGFRRLVAADASRLSSLSGLPAAPTARARVVWNPSSREAVLMVAGLPPAPAGKGYAVWVIAAGAPAPAGVFQVAADGSVTFHLPDVAETAAVKTFAVTVEPSAGTPVPTGPMVLAGTVS